MAPGDQDPGILSASNGVDFNETFGAEGSPTLAIDLEGTTVGTGYDQLNITGAVDLGTRGRLRVIVGGGFVPSAGDTFIIIRNDGVDAVVGTFLNLPEGATFVAGDITFVISYQGGDGNDVTLTSTSGAVTFTTSSLSVSESAGTASITLHRTGGGNTSATVALALEDQTTVQADYVSPAGSLDAAFHTGTGNGADNQVRAVAIQSNGRVIIGGDFNNFNGTARRGIARLTANGAIDTSFNPGTGLSGGFPAGTPFKIVVDPAGKILIGGQFISYNGISRNSIARLNSNGSLDTTFDPGTGVAQTGGQEVSVEAIAVQPDGKILIGGRFNNYNGVFRGRIARLNPDGSLDTSFTASFDTAVTSIALTTDGKILVGGSFADRKGIARLNSDGSSDPTFRGPGNGTDAATRVVVPLPDGGMILGGTFNLVSGSPRRGIVRLDANGELDFAFARDNKPDGNVSAIVLEPDGRIVIGGDFNNYGNVPCERLARIKSDGSLDPSFNPFVLRDPFPPSAVLVRGTVLALTRQPDGKTLMAASHGGFGFREFINRMHGDLVASWGPNDFADKTVQLPIVNDAVFEGNEQLNLRIAPMTNAVAGTPASLTIVDDEIGAPSPPAKAVNIATRLRVATGDNVMIAGFILTGNAPKEVVLRGMGPLLGNFGINDFLADPVVDLRGPGGSILKNNNWKDTQRSQIEGTVYQPGDDRESVIVATLPPDSYTAILTGNNDTTGVGLIEVYDNNSAADSQLANISTRGLVQGNNSVMIGGFILGGTSGNSRIALRAIGPSLAQFGLSGVLADPTLEVRDGNGAPFFRTTIGKPILHRPANSR